MEKDTITNISILSNMIKRGCCPIVNSDGLSPAQGRILHFILTSDSDKKNLFQKDIEAVFNLRPPSATNILKELEHNGFITRETVQDDGRYKRIVATEKALKYKDQVVRELSEINSRLVRGISEENLEIFKSVIRQMTENLQ